MKKIIFVENRELTFLWKAIGDKLKDIYEVHYIVQNKQFLSTKKNSNIHFIPYPKSSETKKTQDSILWIEEIDRKNRYFNGKNKHFQYYFEKINALLDHIQPIVVFGESTQFHELLTIEACKLHKIPYYFPFHCGIPDNRFFFLEYDKYNPVNGNGDAVPPEVLDALIDQIKKFQKPPSYMTLPAKSLGSRIQKTINTLIGYYRGEKFITPSPFVKVLTFQKIKKIIQKWDASAQLNPNNNNHFKILFPLHLQPESSIDVHSYPNYNQKKLAEFILQNIDPQDELYIKPNPKFGFEIDESFMELKENHPNVFFLASQTRMNNLIHDFDLVVTSNGTVTVEAVLNEIPVATFVKTYNNQFKTCRHIKDETTFQDIVHWAKNPIRENLTRDEKRDFLNIRFQMSYPGQLIDPYNYPQVYEPNNMETIVNSFNLFLRAL